MDNLEMSHKSPQVVTGVIKWLHGIYSKQRISNSENHKYLGMDIDYSVTSKVTFSMEKYTHNIISKFPEDLGKTAETPAGEHLFIVHDDTTRRPLPDKQAQIFHRTVAQILFLITRSRRDGRTALAFLSTRVKDPDKDDWAKLRRNLR